MYVGTTSPSQSQGKSSWDRLKEMTRCIAGEY
jgi:hypothetical protein